MSFSSTSVRLPALCRPRRRPPSPLALHESVWDSDLDEKLWDGDLPVWYNGQQLFKPTASDCWTARQVA